MDRYVVMVDAGYLLRQSIEIVSKRSSSERKYLAITDLPKLKQLLLDKSREALDLKERELLRIYWYDGVMSTGMTPQQREIMQFPDIQFRAGTINSKGQQKGVDSLIITDLIELAGNQAVCDAALISGDGDLAVGIELAQKNGVRIALIGIEDLSIHVSHKQSSEVTSRADRIIKIGPDDLASCMCFVEDSSLKANKKIGENQKSNAPHKSNQSNEQRIKEIVIQFMKDEQISTDPIDPETNFISSDIDRSLIHHVYISLEKGRLTNDEKKFARECFIQEWQKLREL